MNEITKKALNYYEENKDSYLDLLKELTKIPSISFPDFPPENVEESADFVKNCLDKIGLQNVQKLVIEGTHPYVYGEWIKDPNNITVLLYAHHDVQSPMREEVWNSPVFEPTEKDGRIYARGIADDKAGILIHIASIECYLKTLGELPINVKVIIEGEEEIGSTHLSEFVQKYTSLLKSDCMVLTDCTNYDTGIPSLTTSLRGLLAMEVTVTAMDHPLHSGMWGGPIPDPVVGLSKIISSLVDENGKLNIPELWDQVIVPTEKEIEDYKKLGMTAEIFKKQAGILETTKIFADNEELLTQIWREPSLTVNSIEAGGKKIAGNVLLDAAWAKIGLRLAPGMNPETCSQVLKDFIKAKTPWGLQVSIEEEPGVGAWSTSPDHPIFDVAKESLKKGYEKDAVTIGCGGTIPFAAPFSKNLGDIPALLVGIEDPYTNAHSENESLDISDFHKAVKSQIHFFMDLAEYAK